MLEHDREHAPGIPEALPDDERILWQGKANFASLLRGTFHFRKLIAYFAVLILLQQVMATRSGAPLSETIASGTGFMLLACTVLGIIALYAWRFSRATMFTVTNRRVIILSGLAVPVTLNLPFSKIDTADLRQHGDGSGDIAITPAAGSRVSYLLLWPLVKPWRLLHVRPVMRAVEDAGHVAGVLGDALVADLDRQEIQRKQASKAKAAETPAPKSRRWTAYPAVPLASAAALVALAIIGVGGAQFGTEDAGPEETANVVASVELFFEDRTDGSVAVVNAADNEIIDVLEPGTNGFVRSTMRTFVRERKAFNVGRELPFRLLRTDAGRLILHDAATGREIDLWAFGHTNAEAFGRFLYGEQSLQPDATAAVLSSKETIQ